jgi:hypothetical protein
MTTSRPRVIPRALRSEFWSWQNDYTLQLQHIVPQFEEMRQTVEGLRGLMMPFDAKFVAAAKALAETTMQLYMVVNDRSLSTPDRSDQTPIVEANEQRREVPATF